MLERDDNRVEETVGPPEWQVLWRWGIGDMEVGDIMNNV